MNLAILAVTLLAILANIASATFKEDTPGLFLVRAITSIVGVLGVAILTTQVV